MKKSILFSLLFLNQVLFCQNLVLNPGFEEANPVSKFPNCAYTQNDKQFNAAVKDWNTFMALTPDVIIMDDDDTDCFYPKPHSGNRMAGIITYHPGLDTGYDFDLHEYIQGKLKAPLHVGKTFEVEFYISQGDSTAINHLNAVYGRKVEIIPCSANNLGFYFLTAPFDYKENVWEMVNYDAIQPQFKIHEIIKTGNNEWMKVKGSFVADYPYQYFVIGNFNKDMDTRTTLENEAEIETYNNSKNRFWEKKKRVAYYCIDDIAVRPIAKKVETNLSLETNFSAILKTAKIYTFENVTFKSGSSELLPVSLPELDGLADFLNENKNVNIEIEGHTDSKGNELANQKLSEKRAKAVADYLFSKGFSDDRIAFIGYGENQPIKSNETPEGRAKNRRVNVKLVN